MEHKFLRLFVDGKWTGHPDRIIRVNGVEHDLDEYAKAHGIKLPEGKKSKKQINKVEEQHADMEHQDHSGDTEES